ncbi:GDSL-type esterase/lipase family protein [Acinetobacter lwoffii]|uniref:GDSL-type esterase/lipase family protein n=1 Tax=Acinetobacter lwoffii TaxID=28090 RepID=UPI001FB46495|nr:GDSL-type esterase/lipase family protein [Acinetobacter lwoffii]MCJ0927928.1 GDSL-type esterase/lipase family protein [Acinetobacter lwoffii]
MTMFLAPYTSIADIDGSPLDAGFVFIGEQGKNPESSPVSVFWDAEFTIPAAQPIRTRNGYPVRNGSPAKIYLKEPMHSISVKNRNGSTIFVDVNGVGLVSTLLVRPSGVTVEQTFKDIDQEINTKADQNFVEEQLELKANAADVYQKDEVFTKTEASALIDPKADQTYVDDVVGAISTDANKQYATLAAANADIANIVVGRNVFISEAINGGYWYKATSEATSLTKSAYDPLTQAKSFADANPLFKPTALTINDNLNSITQTGFYTAWDCEPTIAKNYPVAGSDGFGSLLVEHIKSGSTGSVISQTFKLHSSNGVWHRTTNQAGNSWGAWVKLLNASDLRSITMVADIPEGTDLNNYLIIGQSQTVGDINSYSNLPPQMEEVFAAKGAGLLTVRAGSNNTYIQQYDGYARFGSYYRSRNGNGTWNAWKPLIDQNQTKLKSNVDLNTLTENGSYICKSTTGAVHNFPTLDALILLVYRHEAENVTKQVAYSRGGNEAYIRTYYQSWSPWKRIATELDIANTNAEISKINAKIDSSYAIKSELKNPFKWTKIKLVGDSITWGLGATGQTTSEPRNHLITDTRNTIDTSVCKTWANLLRSWIAKTYCNSSVVESGAGTGYGAKQNSVVWDDETLNRVVMRDKNNAVKTDALKKTYVGIDTSAGNSFGKLINLVSPLHESERPVLMEIDIVSDNITIAYQANSAASDVINVYVDDVLHSTFSAVNASTNKLAEHSVSFSYGKHKIRIQNASTSSSWVPIYGFKITKRVYVSNDGIIGTNSKEWVDSLMSASLVGDEDIVFMMLGTNDRQASYGLAGYKQYISECVNKIKTLSPQAKIVLMSSTFAQTENETMKFSMTDVDSVLETIAKEQDIPFVSHLKYCAQAVLDGVNIWSDGLHLNDAGQKLYFENIVKTIFLK